MRRFAFITIVFVLLAAESQADWSTPSSGKLLVADHILRDPRFVQTVVLLFRYSKDGAAGLILNHPTQVNISRVFPEIVGLNTRKEFIHIGGPVSPESAFLIIQSREPGSNAERIFDNTFITTEKTLMKEVLGRFNKEEKSRLYAGYAGWGAGQLDMEIAGGHWHVLPADSKAVFYSNPTEMWREYFDRSNVIQALDRRRAEVQSSR